MNKERLTEKVTFVQNLEVRDQIMKLSGEETFRQQEQQVQRA